MKKQSISKKLAVLWSKFLAVHIQMGGFVSYIDENITGENFPLQDEDLEFGPVEIISIREYLKSLGRRALSTNEVLAYLAKLGYRPATLLELLLWWLANLAKHANCLIVALGSVWRGNAPYVDGNDGYRYLYLRSIEYDWREYDEFAAVRKRAA